MLIFVKRSNAADHAKEVVRFYVRELRGIKSDGHVSLTFQRQDGSKRTSANYTLIWRTAADFGDAHGVVGRLLRRHLQSALAGACLGMHFIK